MCDMATAGLIMSVVGTGASMLGQQQAASQKASEANYKAAVDRNNAIIANRNAEDARKRGELAANQQRQKSKALQGSQKAALAAAGVLVGADSALVLEADTAALGELDALTIRGNAEREALGLEARAMNFTASSQLNSMAASNAGGGFAMLGTLASGFGSVASKWGKMSSPSGGGFTPSSYTSQNYLSTTGGGLNWED